MRKILTVVFMLTVMVTLSACHSSSEITFIEAETAPSAIVSEQIMSTSSSMPAIPSVSTTSPPTTKSADPGTTKVSVAEPGENPAKPLTVSFQGEQVLEIYSLDYANRRYHKVTDGDKQNAIIAKLEDYTPLPVVNQQDQVGFLVFTDNDKYAFYMDVSPEQGDPADREIVQLSLECNTLYTGVAQWLAYMSTSNIQRVTFSGTGGYGYSGKNHPANETYVIEVDTERVKEIAMISAYLKRIEVSENPQIMDGALNPKTYGDVYILDMHFVSGVRYFICGMKSGISVYASDLDQTISYDCSEEQIQGLRDLMAKLSGLS